MQWLGLLFIGIGFVGGSLTAVLDKDTIDWAIFVPFLLLGAAGVTLVQVAIWRRSKDQSRTQANFQILRDSLQSLVANLGALDADKNAVDVYDLPAHIDATFRQDILSFVEVRESIAHSCGMQAYADVMSRFAAGERYLNRVWSCSADGYIDEAHTYIARSHEQFAEALNKLSSLLPADEADEVTDNDTGATPELPTAKVLADGT